MSARILYGKEFAAKIKESARQGVEELKKNFGVTPGLAVIIVGENPASQVYVRNKHKTCEELGIISEVIAMPEDTTKENLLDKIDELNANKNIHGILVQLPLPTAIKNSSEEILNRIDPLKDVDGFHPVNVGKLVIGSPALVPCTPAGCIEMLDLAVGKPLLHLLMARHATVTICHTHTKNLAEVAREGEILIAASGKPKLVTAEMIRPGATVIDVGINRIAPKKLVGDVDFDAAVEIAGAITPVPGGVGLLTVAMLMKNVVKAAKLQCS